MKRHDIIVMFNLNNKEIKNMASIETKVEDEGINIFIPKDYLVDAFNNGITTGITSKVEHTHDMLRYIAGQIEDGDDDSIFGRCVDEMCAEAIEQGELFLTCET